MITAKRRTVYLVRGRTMLTRAGAYRREAWHQLREESAECSECEQCVVYDHEPCPHFPKPEQVTARAGLLFERDHGEVTK